MKMPLPLSVLLASFVFAISGASAQTQPAEVPGALGIVLHVGVDTANPASGATFDVVQVLENSDAARVGLQAGDVIWAVNGTLLRDSTPEEAQAMLSGPAGSTVDLSVTRGDSKKLIELKGIVRVPRSSFPAQAGAEESGTPAAAEPAVQSPADSVAAFLAETEAQNEAFQQRLAQGPLVPDTNPAPAPAPAPEQAPARKQGFWHKVWNGTVAVAGAMNNAGVTGAWQGSRSYYDNRSLAVFNVDFKFNFYPNGQYEEAVFSGGQQVLYAHGTYQVAPGGKPGDTILTRNIVFTPDQYNVSSDEDARRLAIMGIPQNQSVAIYLGISQGTSDHGGIQLSLENTDGLSDEWGLRPAQ